MAVVSDRTPCHNHLNYRKARLPPRNILRVPWEQHAFRPLGLLLAASSDAILNIEVDCGVNPTTDFPSYPEATFAAGGRSAVPLYGIGQRAIFMTEANEPSITSKDAEVSILTNRTIFTVTGTVGKHLLPLTNTRKSTRPMARVLLVRIARLALPFDCKRP